MPDKDSSTSFESRRDFLEALAIQTYSDLLSDSRVDPSVRKAAADSVMKALGKAEPAKAAGGPGTVVFNFQGGLKTALQGMGQLQNLLARPASDQETEFQE